MGFLKRVFIILVIIVIIASLVIGYLFSKKNQFNTVEINSYVGNDVTGSSPFPDALKIKPVSEQQIIDAIVSTSGPVTVSGVHHSLGGQITYSNSLYLDMSDFDQIIEFDTEKKLITVQSGINWQQIQQVIDPHNLSIKIMQDYNDNTVGGALSINANGRFASSGPIINSVKSIRIILPDGQVYDASSEKNSTLFYGAIGGYGGVGVITQATLELVDNIAIERSINRLSFNEFNDYFKGNILNDESVVLHQAILYPPDFESLLDISWRETDKPLTHEQRLQKNEAEPWWQTVLLGMKSRSAILHRFQKNLIDPYIYQPQAVVRRNFETSYDLRDAGFFTSEQSTMVMQEYLIPVNRFEIFVFNLRDIFSRHDVDIFKILISYVSQNHAGLLAGSTADVYSFKISYLQQKDKEAAEKVEAWTSEIVRASIESHGIHILPYHIHNSTEQLFRAYPAANSFFQLKRVTDPSDRFKNLFWEQHYHSIYSQNDHKQDLPVNPEDTGS